MAPPRRPRKLDASDKELWRKVTETVTPLKARRTPHCVPETPEVSPEDAPPPAKSAGAAKSTPAPPKPQVQKTRAAKPEVAKPPPLNPLDRRLTRRIGRGSRAVDAVIDLHGLTQREAHDRLLAFLQGARARGHRLVLVVTGKGRPGAETDWWAEGARGVLRRAVPEWLATAPFRVLVVGYEQAHIHKGGEGAIYVQIRRKDRQESGK